VGMDVLASRRYGARWTARCPSHARAAARPGLGAGVPANWPLAEPRGGVTMRTNSGLLLLVALASACAAIHPAAERAPAQPDPATLRVTASGAVVGTAGR